MAVIDMDYIFLIYTFIFRFSDLKPVSCNHFIFAVWKTVS